MSELDKIMDELNLEPEKKKEIKERIKTFFINFVRDRQDDAEIGSSEMDMITDPMEDL